MVKHWTQQSAKVGAAVEELNSRERMRMRKQQRQRRKQSQKGEPSSKFFARPGDKKVRSTLCDHRIELNRSPQVYSRCHSCLQEGFRALYRVTGPRTDEIVHPKLVILAHDS
jgi:hypothetical protein